jgi:hypothetical protein
MGDAWWSLANIKTTKFTEEDVAAMTKALEAPDRPQIDRASLHFALAKSIEDTGGEAERSFHHYKLGNEMRRRTVEYDRDRLSAVINGVINIETKEYFERRIDHGCKRQDPIFIIGMPRSGSTLVEQILASHPMIEATNELHDIAYIANRLAGGQSDRATGGLGYIERLMRLNAGQLSALGEEYLERTKIQRKQDKPLFIDKMPANWRYIGLINLILPNAKIIDTRRHPIDCCWSNYKQHYGSGHANSYDLEDMGHFYMEYVKYLIHIDKTLPGRIYRVIHESIIQNTEIEVKNLLDYIGVPFDERCLTFWQNDLIVKTPSSEQVRRPINLDGMNQWKKYEPWLQPLKNVLGNFLDKYPDVVCPLKSDPP